MLSKAIWHLLRSMSRNEPSFINPFTNTALCSQSGCVWFIMTNSFVHAGIFLCLVDLFGAGIGIWSFSLEGISSMDSADSLMLLSVPSTSSLMIFSSSSLFTPSFGFASLMTSLGWFSGTLCWWKASSPKPAEASSVVD